MMEARAKAMQQKILFSAVNLKILVRTKVTFQLWQVWKSRLTELMMKFAFIAFIALLFMF